MIIKKMVLGPMMNNCYILSNEKNNCLIIDPGDNGKKIRKYLEDNNLNPFSILLTHGHFDHIGAVDYLYQFYTLPVYIHEEDQECLYDSDLNLSEMSGIKFKLNSPSIKLKDTLTIDDFEIQIIHLPGHSPGSVGFYFPKEKAFFVGDAIFRGSIGRFDFPTSSKHDTVETIHKLQNFENCNIYPGHGDDTTLEEEKENNYYLINY